jgi:hypothetical protein
MCFGDPQSLHKATSPGSLVGGMSDTMGKAHCREPRSEPGCACAPGCLHLPQWGLIPHNTQVYCKGMGCCGSRTKPLLTCLALGWSLSSSNSSRMNRASQAEASLAKAGCTHCSGLGREGWKEGWAGIQRISILGCSKVTLQEGVHF